MGTSLSSLNNTHAELADKLAALNRWRAEQAAVGTSGGGAVGAGAAGTAAAAGALMAEVEAQVVQRLGPTQKAVEALEQQVGRVKEVAAGWVWSWGKVVGLFEGSSRVYGGV